MISTNNIKVDIEATTLVVTITRPEVYNALNREAKLELARCLEHASNDENIRAIILTGNGKAFCTGQDLNDRATMPNDGKKRDLGETLETEWNPIVRAIANSPKPVIAAVNGVAAGAGMSIAFACDLVISAPENRFISGFSKIGLCPDAGSSHVLAKGLGRHKTMEFFLFNQPLSGEELVAAGIVNEVSSNPLERARELALAVAKLAPLCVSTVKHNLRNGVDLDFKATLALEVEGQRNLGHTEDFAEGVAAFLEKREAVFKGK